MMYTQEDKLDDLFKNSDWKKLSKEEQDSFSSVFSVLNDEEQELIYDLSKRFKIINAQEYIIEFNDLIEKLLSKYPNCKKLYIVANVSSECFPQAKSGNHFAYFGKSTVSQKMFNNIGVKLQVLNDIKKISNKVITDQNIRLVVVDDFIGTGDSTSEFLDKIKSMKLKRGKNFINIPCDKISICSIAIMDYSISRFTAEGYTVFCNHRLAKGLSDYYNSAELNSKIEILNSIHDKLGIAKSENVLGYDSTEALVSLIRTPNNTLPVFWGRMKGKYNPILPRGGE